MKIYDRICAYFIIFAIVLIIAACVGNTSNTPVSHSEEGVEITDTLNGNYVKPSVIVQNGIKGFLFTTYCGKEIFVPEYCIKQTSYEGFYTSLNEAVKAFKKRLNAEIIH